MGKKKNFGKKAKDTVEAEVSTSLANEDDSEDVPVTPGKQKTKKGKKRKATEDTRNLAISEQVVEKKKKTKDGDGKKKNKGKAALPAESEGSEFSSDDEEPEIMEETGEELQFDFEAFPLEDRDKDGIVNMLTQVFLRAKVDLGGLAAGLIKQTPIGTVIGPSEDCDDEDNETSNVVYALISLIDMEKGEQWTKDVSDLLQTRADKYAQKNVGKRLAEVLSGSVGLLINERMLGFPDAIVGPAFKSLQSDIKTMKNRPKHYIYIHKIRVNEDERKPVEAPPPPPQGKKKLGKAAKKRAAAERMQQADIGFENNEDLLLTNALFSFEYPVHSDVEPGSKFHVIKDGPISRKPFRRVSVFDQNGLDAFVDVVTHI